MIPAARQMVVLAVLATTTASSLLKRASDEGLQLAGDWPQAPRSVQDVLASIEDRLRGLDAFGHSLKLARLDFSLEQLARRLEAIEGRLGRLEAKLDLRMGKVEEAVVGRDIKGEFADEHLARRVDNLGEKVNSKVAYLDTKMDMRLERVTNKLELIERDMHNSFEDVLERLVKSDDRQAAVEIELARRREKVDHLASSVQELKTFTKEELGSQISKGFEDVGRSLDAVSRTAPQDHDQDPPAAPGVSERMLGLLQDSRDRIESLSAAVAGLPERRRAAACDGPAQPQLQPQLENLTLAVRALEAGAAQQARKAAGGVQALWRAADELRAGLQLGARELLRQELERLQLRLGEEVERGAAEVAAAVEGSFATLLVAQNAFIDSCSRVQEEETHVYDILQQVVHEMRNRSIADIQKITLELRNQSLQIDKSLAQILTAVMLTSNTTTAAINDLVVQLKQKDNCAFLKVDSIKWKTMESICNQLVEEELEPEYTRRNTPASKINSDTNYLMRTQDHTNFDNDSENEEAIHEYDLDYKISDTEYKDGT